MNNVPRFAREFAQYRKKAILNNELMQEQYKEEMIKRIDSAIEFLQVGLMTSCEAMREIASC